MQFVTVNKSQLISSLPTQTLLSRCGEWRLLCFAALASVSFGLILLKKSLTQSARILMDENISFARCYVKSDS